MTSFTTTQFHLGNYLKDLDYSASFTGQLIALAAFMMVLGKLSYGKLADTIGHRYLLLFMGLMQIIMLRILRSDPNEIEIMSAAVLLGISSGGLIPLMAMVYASRFDPTSFGKVMGLAVFFLAIQSLDRFTRDGCTTFSATIILYSLRLSALLFRALLCLSGYRLP